MGIKVRSGGQWIEVGGGSSSGVNASAWAAVESDGSVEAGASFNCSITKPVGTGRYDVTFTNPMPNGEYSVTTAPAATTNIVRYQDRTANGFSITCRNTSDSAIDTAHSFVVHATNAILPDSFTEEEIQSVVDLAQSDQFLRSDIADTKVGVTTFTDDLIIDAAVGIGTDAPSQTLDVNGNVRLRNALYDVNNETGTSGQVLSSTGSGVDWVNPSDLSVNNATNVVVTDESTDTTCFPLFVTAATGTLPPKTGTNLTFNSAKGILSATEFKGNPYDAVPAYSNSDYNTIRFDTNEFAIALQSDTDTQIGMAFPAFRCNVNSGETFKISLQIRAAATSTGGVYIRLYEYDAELPTGKTHVSNSATNAVVQEDTRIKNLSPTYENQNGNTSWQTLTFDYTPTSTAVWASVVVLNWSGLGNNALYVRDYKRESVVPTLGDGQTWQDVIGSRAAATIYTNTTGRTIVVNIVTQVNDSGDSNYIEVDGVNVCRNHTQSTLSANNREQMTMTAIVPNNSNYELTTIGAGIKLWAELR